MGPSCSGELGGAWLSGGLGGAWLSGGLGGRLSEGLGREG